MCSPELLELQDGLGGLALLLFFVLHDVDLTHQHSTHQINYDRHIFVVVFSISVVVSVFTVSQCPCLLFVLLSPQRHTDCLLYLAQEKEHFVLHEHPHRFRAFPAKCAKC